MDAISQTLFSDALLWMEIFLFWLKFHWSLFLRGSVSNKTTLVKIMALHRIGDMPLSEPMVVTWFTDAYMRHQGEMSCCRRFYVSICTYVMGFHFKTVWYTKGFSVFWSINTSCQLHRSTKHIVTGETRVFIFCDLSNIWNQKCEYIH